MNKKPVKDYVYYLALAYSKGQLTMQDVEYSLECYSNEGMAIGSRGMINSNKLSNNRKLERFYYRLRTLTIPPDKPLLG